MCVFFTGSLYREASQAANLLKENKIDADLYNLRFLKPLDEDYLVSVMNIYKLVCFIEEGIKDGGLGEKISSLALERNCTAKVLTLAAESRFIEEDKALGTREELLAENGLDGINIAKAAEKIYRSL